jgi:YVTN family beta-propeller protein
MRRMKLVLAPLLLAQTLVVANQGAGTIAFVDAKTMAVRKTVEAGVGPHEAAASPDGKLVAVTLYGRQQASKELLIVDPAKDAIVQRFDLAPSERPHGVAWRTGGVYVTLEREGAVARIDPKSGKVSWRATTGGELGHMLAVSRDEKKVYTGNMKTNDISVIRVGENAAYTRIKVGAGPEGIALSPDDLELWAAHRMGGGISVIDTTKDEVVATIAPEVHTARLAFTPDGKKVLAFDMASRAVIVYDRATRKELGRLTPEEGLAVNGLIAADSKKAWVLRYQPDALVELNLDTMKLGRAVEPGQMPDGVAYVK